MLYRDLFQFNPFPGPDLPPPAEQDDGPGVTWTSADLNPERVSTVLIQRLVPKTPEQRVQLRSHLARFASLYGGMSERLEEFVDCFPLHPDCPAVLARTGFGKRLGVLRLLSDAVATLLDVELEGRGPGLLCEDYLWDILRADRVEREEEEAAALIDFSLHVEERLDALISRAGHRRLARRILHGLALRRLAAEDRYSPCGLSAEDLRDALCLFIPDLEVTAPQTPAQALLAELRLVLDELCQGARHVHAARLSVRCHEERYELHFGKFRRFNRPELLLHWINAVPFLLLMASGAIMLGSRFFQLNRELFTTTVTLHKVCALLWFCAMPLCVLARRKQHFANIRVLFTWGRRDLTWTIRTVRSLYDKSVVLAPEDRFNTGQKINSLLVIAYYFGFVSTGILMFAKGSILMPWYIHTGLYFSAMGSVGGHLYLALLNPSTRIALAGIFHGWVPWKYVEHHHSLSMPKALRHHAHEHAEPGPLARELLVSKVEIIVLAVTLLLAGVGFYAFGVARLSSAKQQFEKSFADVIQPSQLTTRHRMGPTAESCTKCHSFTGEITNSKCEDCHGDVKERRTLKLGYHGTLQDDCRTCHREHRDASTPFVPLDKKAFDHNQAVFKLVGKHAEVKCDECHTKPRPKGNPGIYYLGLRHSSCNDCHADRHDGQFKAACSTCHTPAGWTGKNLLFRHDTDTGFPLQAKHEALDCVKCHKPPTASSPLGAARFKGLSKDCSSCHQEPHNGQLPSDCTKCHTTAGWDRRNQRFVHNVDSKFILKARHVDVSCEKCHQPAKPGDPLGRAQFRGLGTGCADCHKEPHRGQFKQACTQCHPAPETWKVSAPVFQHDRDTRFLLKGKHTEVSCLKCHKPRDGDTRLASAQFPGLAGDCASCHQVEHPASYGSTCTSCHSPQNWVPKKPAFDHARTTGFDLAGRHLVAKCSSCHNEAVLGTVTPGKRTTQTCAKCHVKDEPHKNALGAECQKCHATTGWKGEDLLFDHNSMASFALTKDHINVACAKCHKDSTYKPLDATCSSCHKQIVGQKP